jgi:hypothetical protein
MKFICSHKDECNDKACPHAESHDDCGHTCQRVAGARCVMDVAALPIYSDKPGTTTAIFIRRREKAA